MIEMNKRNDLSIKELLFNETYPDEILEDGICQSYQASILLNSEISPDVQGIYANLYG